MTWRQMDRDRLLTNMVEDLTLNEWARIFGVTRQQIQADLQRLDLGINPKAEDNPDDKRNDHRPTR